MIELRLYVAGTSSRSVRALHNLREICRAVPSGCGFDVVDVIERPDLAEADRILVTPTLLRRLPHPARRIIGDLSDRARVLETLDLADGPDDRTATTFT